MPRPQKPRAERFTREIHYRLTAPQYEALQSAGIDMRQSPGILARTLMLAGLQSLAAGDGEPVPSLRAPAALIAAVDNATIGLRNAGDQLNRVVFSWHVDGVLDEAELNHVRQGLHDALETVRAIPQPEPPVLPGISPALTETTGALIHQLSRVGNNLRQLQQALAEMRHAAQGDWQETEAMLRAAVSHALAIAEPPDFW